MWNYCAFCRKSDSGGQCCTARTRLRVRNLHPALRCGEAGLRDPCRNPVSWEVLVGASGEHRECSGGSPVFFCRCCAFSREGCIGGRTGSTHEPHQVIPDHASCEQILRTNRPRSAQPAPLPSMPPVGSLSLSLSSGRTQRSAAPQIGACPPPPGTPNRAKVEYVPCRLPSPG